MSLQENIKTGIAMQAKIKVALIITGIVVAAAALAVFYFNPFGWNFSLSFSKKPKIADTKNVVEHVREISEFTTACYYEEFVVHETKMVAKEGLLGFHKEQPDSAQNELVLLLKGIARAGFDLSKLSEGNLVAKSDTLTINLPAPELFDVIINPSDYEVFVEKGKWSHEEIQTFQVQAKEQLRTHALEEDIIGKAKTEGKERLANLFKTFGYKVVEVNIKE
ncbi:MAG: DUF4230 domain-containing protein [Paludibacteraceae bacterium]|nr:DUF4230 domain-containing protein [Paludibacteraceae bacterium]